MPCLKDLRDFTADICIGTHSLFSVSPSPCSVWPNERRERTSSVVIAEVSIFPLGTGSPSVSGYVRAAVEALEASGLKCTLGLMGTTVEAESVEEVYAALARAQAAVFELGVGRVYTELKMDERRDVEDRSAEDMVRAVREEH